MKDLLVAVLMISSFSVMAARVNYKLMPFKEVFKTQNMEINTKNGGKLKVTCSWSDFFESYEISAEYTSKSIPVKIVKLDENSYSFESNSYLSWKKRVAFKPLKECSLYIVVNYTLPSGKQVKSKAIALEIDVKSGTLNELIRESADNSILFGRDNYIQVVQDL